MKTNNDFKTAPLTWLEQRHFVENAVAALTASNSSGSDRNSDDADPTDEALAAAIQKEFAAIQPTPFDESGMVDAPSLSTVFPCQHATGKVLSIGFSSAVYASSS